MYFYYYLVTDYIYNIVLKNERQLLHYLNDDDDDTVGLILHKIQRQVNSILRSLVLVLVT
jgi:hypothetical protein